VQCAERRVTSVCWLEKSWQRSNWFRFYICRVVSLTSCYACGLWKGCIKCCRHMYCYTEWKQDIHVEFCIVISKTEMEMRNIVSGRGLGILLFTTVSRTALGPTQPPIQWGTRGSFPGVKRPGCEADHSPLSSVEVKNAWSYTSTPPIRIHGVVLS
jgi:hypothetical protein